jgi:branched-chain amino acid transport system permease protein
LTAAAVFDAVIAGLVILISANRGTTGSRGLELIIDNCYAPYQIARAEYNCRRTKACNDAFAGGDVRVNTTILLFLLQDGVTNGAIYALLGLALVLVFAVTRVILIPQGEFITFGALTYATLSAGGVPGTAQLALMMGVVAFGFELFGARKSLHLAKVVRAALIYIVFPAVVLALATWLPAHKPGVAVNIALSLLIVAAIGLFLYRIAFQPLAHTSVLVLLIASVGCHLALQGFGLVFFGAEGLRGPPLSDVALSVGPLLFTGQSLAVYGITLALMAALWLFFGFTRYGKALRATAVNRLGARLVGIRTSLSGQIAFLLASVIGAISGILIVPITTLYYDTGFLIGLKGFVAAIIGGLVSYPLTAVAALVVGIVESFSSFYASNYKEVIVFTLILPVLVLRSLAAPAVEEEKD